MEDLKRPCITVSASRSNDAEVLEWNRIVEQRKKDKKERKITKDKNYVIVKGRRTRLSALNIRQVQRQDT